jgi:adenosyl cobinamide kinase/adenosyl cobinamide phosphate guanylyltransferase
MTMSLETTLAGLRRDLAHLQDAVSALRVTVIEDRPARGSVVLVDHLENVITELSSALEEADAHVTQALQQNQPNGTLDALRTALPEIHELLNRFVAKFVSELGAHDHIARLLEMGKERGREWRAWTGEVKRAIERCAVPMAAVTAAMVECWSELAERLARNSVSVQATNIGQQITVRDDQLEIAGKAS